MILYPWIGTKRNKTQKSIGREREREREREGEEEGAGEREGEGREREREPCGNTTYHLSYVSLRSM